MDRCTIAGVTPRVKLAAAAFNATEGTKWLAVRRGSTKRKVRKIA